MATNMAMAMVRPPGHTERGAAMTLAILRSAAAVPYRVALVLAVFATAWLVLASGLTRRYDQARPSLPLGWTPGDARALAYQAAGRIRIDATPSDLVQARAEALKALRRDLTIASAYAVLGAVADMRGQRVMARADMGASDALSRRVLLARLWMIQDAVARGRVAEALHHFDIALRTSEDAKPLLFPALGRALGDDRLVPAIAALLQGRPTWAGDFLYTSIVNGVASDNLARVMEQLHPVPDFPGADLRSLLITQLAAEGHFAGAYRLALPRLPFGRRSLVIDPAFSDPRGDAPFNWALADTADVTAERIGQRPGLQVRADRDAGGDAASQALMLPPGSYALSSRSEDATRPADAPVWTIRCTAMDRTLATLPITGPRFSETAFSVPADCSSQWLRLTLRPGRAQALTIDRVDVRRVTTGTPR